MKRCLKCLAAAAALAPVAGLLIAWLGIIHVGATGGHWAVTEWFLHWTMRSSVRTAALGIKSLPVSKVPNTSRSRQCISR